MLPTESLLVKDPQSSAWPKGIDYTDYLALIDPAETITGSTWAITGNDAALTKSNESIVTGAKKTQLRLAGGTLGLTYTVTNHITTSSGVQDDRSFDVLIQQQ